MRVIHIFLLAPDNFLFLKSIDINKAIEKFISDLESSEERQNSAGIAIELRHSIQEEFNDLMFDPQYVSNIKF